MFKHTIKYTDYNGTPREEQFLFNLSRAELMKMELSTTAGFEEKIRMLIATKNNAEIMNIYEDLILNSYGIKSEDGRRFIKSEELKNQFKQSEAYSELLMQLLGDDKFQAEFLNGIINGTNVPVEIDDGEAIKKLKELGYDTSAIEAALSEKNATNKVVSIEDKVDKNVENH